MMLTCGECRQQIADNPIIITLPARGWSSAGCSAECATKIITRQASAKSSVKLEWEPLIGRKVVFLYFHGEQQEGVVTSCNDKYVFVRFGLGDTSESCDPSMLKLVQ